jgi:8-oxo-dGTP pyrophosphatase MutT (NUDIX family)
MANPFVFGRWFLRGSMPPDWIRSALVFDSAEFRPLIAGTVRAGWLRPAFAARLVAWSQVFSVSADHVAFSPGLADSRARSSALAAVLQALREQGLFPGWRNELYALIDPASGEELLRFERAAARHFGFVGTASHLNGLVPRADGLCMWVATRSANKAVAPGRLDNMVAGGMPAGMDAAATLVKECFEEAGMPPALAARAVPRGSIAFTRAVPEGVDAQRIAVFDIELPPDFVPRNQDGEVAGFELLPASKILQRLREPDAFTVDAALVAWDCLKRHGCAY